MNFVFLFRIKVLITSNDSRIRLYDIRTKEIERKYRGYSNQSSQIRSSFSHDDKYIIRYASERNIQIKLIELSLVEAKIVGFIFGKPNRVVRVI